MNTETVEGGVEGVGTLYRQPPLPASLASLLWDLGRGVQYLFLLISAKTLF